MGLLDELVSRIQNSDPARVVRNAVTGSPLTAPSSDDIQTILRNFQMGATAPLMLPMRYAQGVGDMAKSAYDKAGPALTTLQQELLKRLR